LITNLHLTSQEQISYRVTFEQDAIFYGAAYLNSVLNDSSNIYWHIQDGQCILKHQICMEVLPTIQNLKEHIRVISYLSGISTLSCCYSEVSSSIPIIGSSFKDSSLSKWEINALKTGGVTTYPVRPSKICSVKEDLRLTSNIIALDSTQPLDILKDMISIIPPHKTKGLYGPILPQDIDQFKNLDIDALWPQFLETHWPCIKINIYANT